MIVLGASARSRWYYAHALHAPGTHARQRAGARQRAVPRGRCRCRPGPNRAAACDRCRVDPAHAAASCRSRGYRLAERRSRAQLAAVPAATAAAPRMPLGIGAWPDVARSTRDAARGGGLREPPTHLRRRRSLRRGAASPPCEPRRRLGRRRAADSAARSRRCCGRRSAAASGAASCRRRGYCYPRGPSSTARSRPPSTRRSPA